MALGNNESNPTLQKGTASPRRSQDILNAPSKGKGHTDALSHARNSLEPVNEQSPLLPASQTKDSENQDVDSIERLPQTSGTMDYSDDGYQKSKSSWYLFLLTLSIGGLQIVWSVEMSNGSPFLLSLGMDKSLLAFVWIAGPLSGTLVQPYVGIRSDNCRISWGKRKPFMLAGGAATIVALMALAWTREIVGGFLALFGADPASKGVRVTAIVWAVFFMYTLDFAINTVQAGIRAFIVDNAPCHQQESANAWAGRLTGVGNVVGYLSGYVNLPQIMPFFGNTQFKVLCVIACLCLGATLSISCSYVRERDPRLDGPPSSDTGVLNFFKNIYGAAKRLPPQIRKVCMVQFFNWIGWFPFMFYITTYIGQLYVNPIFEAHPNMSDEDINNVWEHATRIGTFALLIFAIVSFFFNILLPFLVVPSYKPLQPFSPPELSRSQQNSSYISIPRTPTTPGTVSASMTDYFAQPHQPEPTGMSGLLLWLRVPGLTLTRAWLLSHVLFALCMWATLFIDTTRQATLLVAMVGICWALTLWAPFALISAEISKQDAERRFTMARRRRRFASSYNTHASSAADNEPLISQNDRRDDGKVCGDEDEDDEESKEADQAGVILGLHNVAIAAPQVIATLLSSVIFKLLQKPRGTPGDDSVGWVLRAGGISALMAAWMASQLEEDGEDDKSLDEV